VVVVLAPGDGLELRTDSGARGLGAGDCAVFPANSGDAHCLCNTGSVPALYLELGSSSKADVCHYPDDDMRTVLGTRGTPAASQFTHADGTPYPRL